ncbi:MAG: hypothetical protein IPN68_18395 [Bacteroidetes bacterium]|nr:hypothetical protein [Bacteroidota bacterium]
MKKKKKTSRVSLIGGTVTYRDSNSIEVVSSEKLIYRIDFGNFKHAAALYPGDLVWLLQLKAEHLIEDIIPYENNESLSEGFSGFEVEV